MTPVDLLRTDKFKTTGLDVESGGSFTRLPQIYSVVLLVLMLLHVLLIQLHVMTLVCSV